MSKWKVSLGFPETQGTYGFLLVLIIDALGSAMYLPLSILYFQITASFPLASIGLTLTIATICTLPLTFIAGSLVDRFGARRVTASSQFIQMIGLLGYLFVNSIPLLFLTALLVTGGTRMFYAAHAALIGEIATPQERDRWYGLAWAIRNVGGVIGGFCAGIVLALDNPDIYRLLIGISALCYAAAGGLLLLQPEPAYRFEERVKHAHYGTVLKDRLFLGFLMSNMAFLLCGLMLGPALPIYITEAIQAPLWILSVLAFNSLLGIGCQTLIVRLLEQHRRTRAIAVAALVWCLSCSLFVLAYVIPQAFIAPYIFFVVALHLLASLIYTPTVNALIVDLASTGLRGRYLATYEFTWGIANALTPALFTSLYAITPTLPWIVLAMMAATSGSIMLWLERKLPTQAVRGENRTQPMPNTK